MRRAITVLSTAALFVLAADSAAQGFTYTRRVDPITDLDRSSIYSRAVSAPRSILSQDAMIMWRCNGADEIDLIIGSGEYLDNERVQVQLRFDDEASEGAERWSPSTDGTGVFAPDSRIMTLTEKARPANRLRVRLQDFQGSTYDYEFSLAGLSAGLDRLGCYKRSLQREADDVRRRGAEDEEQLLWMVARADSLAALGAFVGDFTTGLYYTNTPRDPSCKALAVIYKRGDGTFFLAESAAVLSGYKKASCN